MKKLREQSKTSVMNKSFDEMTKSWDALRGALFREGWAEPEASLTEADGRALVGERIYVMGYGAGKVKDFVHNRMGASKHVVELDDGPRTETIVLRRKGNDKTPFLVRSHLTSAYRRRRDNLTHREPWSKGPGDLKRQLSADEANSIWESFDQPELLDQQQKINMTASMDGHGNLMARPNLLDVTPGDFPSLRLASAGSSDTGSDTDSTDSPSPALRNSGRGAPPSSPRVRLVDTKKRPTSMLRSAPEVRMLEAEAPKAVVASDRHRCPLTRKDWDMLPGMGLYCDHCERLCRAFGEWFSWNCPGCDYDICNKCLQESRDSWAIVTPPGEENLPAIVDADVSGDWMVSLSGNAYSAAAKNLMGTCRTAHRSDPRAFCSQSCLHEFASHFCVALLRMCGMCVIPAQVWSTTQRPVWLRVRMSYSETCTERCWQGCSRSPWMLKTVKRRSRSRSS